MDQPKISVIVPAVGMSDCQNLRVDSLLQQTMKHLEIICLVDRNWEPLEKLAGENGGIKLCRLDSQSLVEACKAGLTEISGEYVLFLWPQDSLEPEACARLYQRIQKEKVDILHFSSCTVGKTGEKRLIQPSKRRLQGEKLFTKGLCQEDMDGGLWNKLYRVEVCKQAFFALDEQTAAPGEDRLAFFAIACCAQSYYGWSSQPLCTHWEETTGDTALEALKQQCKAVQICQRMALFCEKHPRGSLCKGYAEQCQRKLLRQCCDSWYSALPARDSGEGWETLCHYWGRESVTLYMAQAHFEERAQMAGKLKNLPRIRLDGKNVKTIGIYYHKMCAGGVERVNSLLAHRFLEMGYRVVIVTDEPPSDHDFLLPEEVQREVVFSNTLTDANSVDRRFASWAEIIEKHRIDVVLYSAWLSELLLWDLLRIKGMGIPFLVHTHGVFSCVLSELRTLFAELPGTIGLADGIITLTQVDKRFWDLYCPNVYCIPNPPAGDLANGKPGIWENRTLIWVGRPGQEKQPEKMLDIMERVVSRSPDVKLSVLGDFSNPKWKRMVRQKKLEENVCFYGQVRDVGTYLEKASVFVCTSKFEGFPMALAEAQAHSLPTVMFRLPHVTMAAPDRGVVSVEMNDVDGAAQEILNLLGSETLWNEQSAQAYRSYCWLRDYDLAGDWNQVFTGVVPERTRDEQTALVMDTWISHYDQGCQNRENVVAPAWFLQKLGGSIQCCAENGLSYTLRLAVRKIKNRFLG